MKILISSTTTIDKKSIKIAMKITSNELTNDGFQILIRILKEVTPTLGNFGTKIDHQQEINKLNLQLGMTFASLWSTRLKSHQTFQCSKDKFHQNKLNKTFLEQLT